MVTRSHWKKACDCFFLELRRNTKVYETRASYPNPSSEFPPYLYFQEMQLAKK